MTTKVSLRMFSSVGQSNQRLSVGTNGLILADSDDTHKRYIVDGSYDSGTGTLVLTLANSNRLIVSGFLTASNESDESKRGQSGAQGIDGTNGLDGRDGVRGRTGGQGEKGPKGNKGPIGLPGSKGPKGINGDTGVPGAEGSEGTIGDKGEPGERGPKGILGDIGVPGSQGPVGRQLYAIACLNRELVFTFNDGSQRKVGLRPLNSELTHRIQATHNPALIRDIPNPDRDPYKERVILLPKYGSAECGLTVASAYSTLTQTLDNTLSGNTLVFNIQSTFYGYFLIPKSIAQNVSFQQVDDAGVPTQFVGGWDGATWACTNDAHFEKGPLSGTIDADEWLLYRTDASGLGSIRFKISY